jgi:hypothetical protein
MQAWARIPSHRKIEDIDDSVSLERCRALLGSDADGLTDREIEELRRNAEAAAHILIELFLRTKEAAERS